MVDLHGKQYTLYSGMEGVFGRAWRGYVYVFEIGTDRGCVCVMRDR